MIYECLFHGGKFLIAKPKGWAWSMAERSEPFEIRDTPELTVGEVDWMVEVGGAAVVASAIDKYLVREIPPWQR